MTRKEAIETLKDMKGVFGKRSHEQYSLAALDLAIAALENQIQGGLKMKNYNNDEIIRFFEAAGYNNVEIIGDRLIFTTGEEIFNWSIQEAINFMKG